MSLKNREKYLKYQKEYNNRPEVKERYRKQNQEYYQKNKIKCRENQKKYRDRPEIKAKKKEYDKSAHYKSQKKEYHQRPEVKERIKRYIKNRFENDKNFNIKRRLSSLLWIAFKKYTKTGKVMSSKKYGINYVLIIEHLKPFPEDISKYHIDHIRPLCSFDLTNPEEIKEAFKPENHQWLLAKENRIKGGRVPCGAIS